MFDINIDYDEETGIIQDYCTSRGFPLGGLGTGGFSIFTDGGFGKFRTNHNWFKSINEAEYPKGTFFAIWVRRKEEVVTKILRRAYQNGKEYNNVENVQHTQFKGLIPCFELIFSDDDINIKVKLSGFTSLIPHNVKDSSLPLAFFEMELENPNSVCVEQSLLFSFENILGIGGSGGWTLVYPLSGPVSYKSTKGNYNENYDLDDVHGISFKTKQKYGMKNPRRRVIGEYFIYSDVKSKISDVTITKCLTWDSKSKDVSFWDEFKQNGEIKSCNTKGNAGAFAIKSRLQSKEKIKIHFYLMWWTPYHIIERKQRLRKLIGIHKGKDYGHYYLQFFNSPEDLIKYSINQRERLKKESQEIIEILDKSTLPNWLKTYILNSTDSMLTNSVLTREGNYYMMEGVPWNWPHGALTGTIDMRLASHVYSSIFFPLLDINELNSFLELTKNGCVPHGNGHADIALGTKKIPYGEPILIFNRTKHWVDLPQSLIMQMGKIILQIGDIQLLKDFWKKVPEIIHYLDQRMINDIPEGITTYDYIKYHPCFVYTAILHLATLKMIITLAELLKSDIKESDLILKEKFMNFIQKYKDQFEATEKSYLKRLWVHLEGGGYFKTSETRNTVFTSALAGDWISRFSGLGPIVDYEKALSHSQFQSKLLIDSHNILKKRGKKTRPLVYREANLDGIEMPFKVLLYKIYQANNPYQSVAFQGLEAIYLGRIEAGLNLIKKIWEKGYYEGYPWDRDHWGGKGHIYMSHPSLWAIFHALTGASYNAFEEKLMISPQLLPKTNQMKIPVFFPKFWLFIKYSKDTNVIDIEVLKSFNSNLRISKIIQQYPNGKQILHDLDKTFIIETGEKITVVLKNISKEN